MLKNASSQSHQSLALDPREWLYYGQWEQPPISGWFWSAWYDAAIVERLGLPKLDGRVLFLNGHHVAYKRDIEVWQKALEKACADHNSKFFKRIHDSSKEIFDTHKNLVRALQAHAASDGVLFDHFLSSSLAMMIPWTVGLIFSDHLGELLIHKSAKLGIDLNKIVKYIPQHETLMIQEYREAAAINKLLKQTGLLRAGEERLKQNQELWNRINNHVKKYEWVGTHHFWGSPLSVEKFLKEVDTVQTVEPSNPQASALSSDLQFMVTEAGQLTWLRQYTPELFDLVAFAVRPLLRRIGEKIGCSYENILYLTPPEILLLVKEEKRITSDFIEKRKQGYYTIRRGSEVTICDDQTEIRQLSKIFVPLADTSVTEFSGTVACKGYAKGLVKVFLVPEHLEKMQAGDILVTPMTTPDFVPLMKKAGAIVTDTGGLLSHAALVSRELQKPCIIGTKVATKVFKDGDRVEVDAEKGIVRKI